MTLLHACNAQQAGHRMSRKVVVATVVSLARIIQRWALCHANCVLLDTIRKEVVLSSVSNVLLEGTASNKDKQIALIVFQVDHKV